MLGETPENKYYYGLNIIVLLFIMSPHSNDFNNIFIFIYLIN